MNVRLGRMGAVAITFRQCSSALSGWRWLQAMQVCVCVSLCAMRGRERERGSLGSVCCAVHHCSSTPAPDLCPYRGADCLPPYLSAPLSLLSSRGCADDALFHYSRRRETSCRFSKNPQGTGHPDYLQSESLPACWFAFLSFLCLNS